MFLFSLCSHCLFSTVTHWSCLGKLEEVEYLNLITQYEVNPIHVSALSIIPIPFSCVPFCIRVIQSCTYLLLIAYLLAYLFHHLFDKENNKESESKDNELD